MLTQVDTGKGSDFFFFSISTLGFHSVISATLLHIFAVQKVSFGVNKTLI